MESNANLDSITGDPKKAINKLAYPLMASMLLIMLNNIIDGAWVAGLGPEPLAAIGFITPLFMILVGVGNGVGAGANSLISRYIGAKDRKGANNAAIHSICCNSCCCSINLNFNCFPKRFTYYYGSKQCY